MIDNKSKHTYNLLIFNCFLYQQKSKYKKLPKYDSFKLGEYTKIEFQNMNNPVNTNLLDHRPINLIKFHFPINQSYLRVNISISRRFSLTLHFIKKQLFHVWYRLTRLDYLCQDTEWEFQQHFLKYLSDFNIRNHSHIFVDTFGNRKLFTHDNFIYFFADENLDEIQNNLKNLLMNIIS